MPSFSFLLRRMQWIEAESYFRNEWKQTNNGEVKKYIPPVSESMRGPRIGGKARLTLAWDPKQLLGGTAYVTGFGVSKEYPQKTEVRVCFRAGYLLVRQNICYSGYVTILCHYKADMSVQDLCNWREYFSIGSILWGKYFGSNEGKILQRCISGQELSSWGKEAFEGHFVLLWGAYLGQYLCCWEEHSSTCYGWEMLQAKICVIMRGYLIMESVLYWWAFQVKICTIGASLNLSFTC